MKMLKFGKWNFDISKVIGFVFGVIFTTCVTVLAETCQTTLNSNSVTYDNTTVEATTTSLLSQAGNIDNRVSTLEGKFLNGTSAYFDGADSSDILYIGKGNSTADIRGVYLYGSNNVLRSTYVFDKANQKIKLTAHSTTTSGAGPLEIIGKPITIDATTGGNGNLNLNGNVKINGNSFYDKTTKTITPSVGSGSIKVYCYGTVCEMIMVNYNPGTITARATVGTIPQGYRPPGETYCVSSSHNNYMGIKADGTIWVDPPLSGTNLYVTCTYVAWN